MKLIGFTRARLLDYTLAQIASFFPDGADVRGQIDKHLDESLERLRKCINSVRCWEMEAFNYQHSTQYCIYLYFLSNTIWRHGGSINVCTKLFSLNKALNGIDCFYEVELPERFFIGHSVGIVLAKATYSDYLVLYQNSTVGKNHGVAPVLEEGVVMYPNTAIIGECHVGPRTILAQGTSIINRDTQGNQIVFNTSGAQVDVRNISRDVWSDIFR